MKNQLLILFSILTKVSYASFPVLDKTTEPEPGSPGYFMLLAVIIVASVFRSFQYKKKYDTFYKPWSAYTGIEKILAYIGFGIIGLLIIVLFIALINPDALLIT